MTFKLNGVTIKVNGSQIKETASYGRVQFNFTVPNYSAKDYNLTAVCGFLDSRVENTTTFTIIKSDPELILDNITSNGTTGRITGVLLDEHGVGVDRDTKVAVKVNGKTLLNTRIYDGIIDLTFDTSAYKDGVHNLTVIFGENGCYSTVTYIGKLAQNTGNVIICDNVTGKNGEVVLLSAFVIDEYGNSATSGSATFKLNGVTIKDNSTRITVNFKNGVAEYNYTIPDYSAKDYNLTAVASVDGNRYESSSVLSILKTDAFIEISPITATEGSTILLTGTIVDENNKTITADTKLAMKVNNKTDNHANAYNGLIRILFNTSKYPVGTYTVEIISGENGRYNTASTTTTLTIISDDSN